MPFVSDSFVDTAGTAINAHTGETGASWTEHPSYTADLLISDANRLRGPATAAQGASFASGLPASAEYDVVGKFHVLDDADLVIGVCGRMSTSADTFYTARYRAGVTDEWQLFKFVAGAATSLGSFGEVLTPGNLYTIRLEIRDAAKKVYINGVERISSADNVITEAGRVGIRAIGASSDSTGQHIDSIFGLAPGESLLPLRIPNVIRVPSIPTLARC